jgi:signal peptidase I
MKRLANWLVFMTFLSGVWWLAGPTHLGGPASYVIVDGRSMEPTYRNGDLVVARERERYKIGDVIVYDAPIEQRFEVIHRIVAPTDGGFVTQGDNMERPDGWIAPHHTIHGSASFHIPRGGTLVAFLRQPAAILGLIAGWVAFELVRRSERTTSIDMQHETAQGGEA